MIFEQVRMGGDRNFGYLLGDEASGLAAIVDPSYAPEKLLEKAAGHGLAVKYIICTHDHHDHTNGNDYAKRKTGAEIVLHEKAGVDFDRGVKDGDVLTLGNLELKIIHTPGHTPDSICVLAGKKLLTGDTLYVDKIGGTHDDEGARIQYDSLWNKLMTLPDDTEVFAAHDVGSMPSSTIGREKKENHFLKKKNFEDFLWLKNNWAAYKSEQGID